MSRLSTREFNAMNNPLRRILQRGWEFPMLQRFGVQIRDRDVLEVGCGSGCGAQLIAAQHPHSYLGFDYMPEQIVLARQRIPAAQFPVQDAADMKDVSSASRDTVF
jgi:ubiquinone/menaquinone biosynthesis C-methylase UbiE